MSKKEIKELIHKAEEQGWTISKTNGAHWKWVSPIGGFFFSASSPSDNRAIKNVRSDLKRYGFIEVRRK